jgi:hypothetical protein
MNAKDNALFERILTAASLDELRDLNARVVYAIRDKRSDRDFNALRKLRIGQKVSFTARGDDRTGRITRINRTTVSVDAKPLLGKGPAEPWRIHAGALTVIR